MPSLSDTIYEAWRVTFNTTFPLFYSDIATNNGETLHFDNGCIVVCNHPCTLMDPLHLAVNSNRSIHFVVNASLYVHPVSRKFFQTMYSIPIERQEDAKNRGAKKVDNKNSFSVCSNFLNNNGSIFMAPQGGSYMERRVRKLKTGAARIALAAASEKKFDTNLTILPVGLNYSDPRYFRSTILVNSGEHIRIADFKEAYERDAFGAAQLITKEIAKQFEQLMIDTIDEEEDSFVRKIETLYASEEKRSLIDDFNLSKVIISQGREQKKNNPSSFQEFEKNVTTYFDNIDTAKLTDKTIQLAANNSTPSSFISILKIILGFPFFLYGAINSMIPAFVAKSIAHKLSSIKEYIGTYKFVFGFFGFPFFYAIQSWLVYHFTGSGWLTLVYFLSLIPLGLFAWRYGVFAKGFSNQQKLRSLARSKKDTAEQLVNSRNELIHKLNKLGYPNINLKQVPQSV